MNSSRFRIFLVSFIYFLLSFTSNVGFVNGQYYYHFIFTIEATRYDVTGAADLIQGIDGQQGARY